jgi:hypothetical protein
MAEVGVLYLRKAPTEEVIEDIAKNSRRHDEITSVPLLRRHLRRMGE